MRLNRNFGYTSYRLSPDVLTSSAAERQYKNFYKMDAVRPQRGDLIPWDLDLKNQTASPRLLQSSGFRFSIPVHPMLGCIGVAAPGDEVVTSGPAGSYGGNMDYNDVVEGRPFGSPCFTTVLTSISGMATPFRETEKGLAMVWRPRWTCSSR